ncbi:hypothetical protein EXIGLDRAFT_770510 [Exidia glandulosa HHB12029]|uniref:Uncharacterized protein n=1 Tax=Exidia glandulosa HHB12029 TaxID=1314781 RepID=A0A165GMU1_EXIGL|nr:hypothetical protein EXIGLDRAFT_770510 [Exidia glandulosa HHB12029]
MSTSALVASTDLLRSKGVNDVPFVVPVPLCSRSRGMGLVIWLNRLPRADEVCCTTCGVSAQFIIIIHGKHDNKAGVVFFICKVCSKGRRAGDRSFAGFTKSTQMFRTYTKYSERAATPKSSPTSSSQASSSPSSWIPPLLPSAPPAVHVLMGVLHDLMAKEAQDGGSKLQDALKKAIATDPARDAVAATSSAPTVAVEVASTSTTSTGPSTRGAWQASAPHKAVAAMKARAAALSKPIPGARAPIAPQPRATRKVIASIAPKPKKTIWRLVATNMKDETITLLFELPEGTIILLWEDLPDVFRSVAARHAVELLHHTHHIWTPFGLNDVFDLVTGGDDIVKARIVSATKRPTELVIEISSDEDEDADTNRRSGGGSSSGTSVTSSSSKGKRKQRTVSFTSPSSQIDALDDFFSPDDAPGPSTRPKKMQRRA